MMISHGYHGTQGPGAKNSDVVWLRVGQVRSMPGRSNRERSVVAFLSQGKLCSEGKLCSGHNSESLLLVSLSSQERSS